MAPLFTGLRLSFGRSAEVAGPSAVPAGITATGGTTATPGNGYAYHTFGTPGTFAISAVTGTGLVECLIVAGGGGGGNKWGGGGGAGGLIYGESIPVSATSYPISIGNGGIGASGGGNGDNYPGTPAPGEGQDTTAFGYTAKGGGKGGSGDTGPSSSGGSGGGGCGRFGQPGSPATQPAQTPTSNIVQYGNAGGDTPGGNDQNTAGGGGGGAGAQGFAGGQDAPGSRGNGGVGLQYPQFTGPLIGSPALNPLSGYFAGGGGGNRGAGATGNGGLGGGGDATPSTGTAGTTNSGGGGGCASPTGPNGIGGNGGSGIVVIRYLA